MLCCWWTAWHWWFISIRIQIQEQNQTNQKEYTVLMHLHRVFRMVSCLMVNIPEFFIRLERLQIDLIWKHCIQFTHFCSKFLYACGNHVRSKRRELTDTHCLSQHVSSICLFWGHQDDCSHLNTSIYWILESICLVVIVVLFLSCLYRYK